MEIINDFVSLVSFIEPDVTIKASRDQKDDQFLELAVAAKAICIISGDNDLLVLHPFRDIPIITAASYLDHNFN